MITTNRREQCDNCSTKQMAKINYTQQERDAIAQMKENDVLALNIKRIAPTKGTTIKNFSIEIRQKMPNGNNSFNLLSHFNSNDQNFQGGSGVRVAWLTIKAEEAVSTFSINAAELDNLALDGGASRIFIGAMNPTFTVPNGAGGVITKSLQLQKWARLLVPSVMDPMKEKYYYDNVLTEAKKAGADGRYTKGAYTNEQTGEITAEYIIELCRVRSATLVKQENGETALVNDNWEHITIDEYTPELANYTTETTTVVEEKAPLATIKPL